MCWWKIQHGKHRTKVRCFHIFTAFFRGKKFEKPLFHEKQFYLARGDILKMHPTAFPVRNDSNTKPAKTKKTMTNRLSPPFTRAERQLFSYLGTIGAFAWSVHHSLVVLVNSYPRAFRVYLGYNQTKENKHDRHQKLMRSDPHRPAWAGQRRTGTTGANHQRVHH